MSAKPVVVDEPMAEKKADATVESVKQLLLEQFPEHGWTARSYADNVAEFRRNDGAFEIQWDEDCARIVTFKKNPNCQITFGKRLETLAGIYATIHTDVNLDKLRNPDITVNQVNLGYPEPHEVDLMCNWLRKRYPNFGFALDGRLNSERTYKSTDFKLTVADQYCRLFPREGRGRGWARFPAELKAIQTVFDMYRGDFDAIVDPACNIVSRPTSMKHDLLAP